MLVVMMPGGTTGRTTGGSPPRLPVVGCLVRPDLGRVLAAEHPLAAAHRGDRSSLPQELRADVGIDRIPWFERQPADHLGVIPAPLRTPRGSRIAQPCWNPR